jgi:cytochrome c oxidase cbb3-type subunit 4
MDFNVNDLRSIITVLTFLMFVGIVWWAFSSHRKAVYDEAARLPLDDDSPFVSEGTGHPSHPDK